MHQCLGVILKPTQNLKDVLAPCVHSEENQNGFMDYYYIGNKWANSLRLKPGGKEIYLEGPMSDHIISEAHLVEVLLGGYRVNCEEGYADMARIGDIDFGPDPKIVELYDPVWETLVHGAAPTSVMKDEIPWLCYDPECAKLLLDTFGDKECFLTHQSCFPFEYVLTPDGIFREQDVDCFDCQGLTICYDNSGTFTERLKEFLSPDNVLVVVDYHIS